MHHYDGRNPLIRSSGGLEQITHEHGLAVRAWKFDTFHDGTFAQRFHRSRRGAPYCTHSNPARYDQRSDQTTAQYESKTSVHGLLRNVCRSILDLYPILHIGVANIRTDL
jgi:hypothetical protein